MRQLTRNDEGLLADQYEQPSFLPPLWRVIFQEAMRGHHLIFPKHIVQVMQEPGSFQSIPMTAEGNEALEEFCVHLFAAPDLKAIRTLIHLLPIAEQKQLFVIYVHLMKSIRERHKEVMN
jgi:hypothetical protein